MIISRQKTFKSILLAATILASPMIAALPTSASAEVALGISVQIAPPELPVYDQPPMPEVGYLWTPGYWAWADPVGYYWVPGTWVQPPTVGYLWTPPYWGWVNGAYLFNDGYWGAHVGFYGGVNYGYGYGGRGYEGGRWDNGGFVYNRAANNFGSVNVTNTYTRNVTVINRTQVSYVGGTGGIHAQPTAAESAALHEQHAPATADQTRHIETAKANPDFAASKNNGHPAIAATSRPGQFEGAGVTHPRAAAAGPAIKPKPTNAAAAPGAQARPANAAAAPGPAIKPKPTNAAAAPAAQPRPTNAAAAPGPAIKPKPTNATASTPARPTHPAAAQANPAQPKPQPTAAKASAPPRPAHPTAAAQAAPPKPTHPAPAAKAAAPERPAPAAHAAPAKPAAEPEKADEKKTD
jgi:hypothetical protein